tara:strand:- start:986 stop:1240 length:255 start_codon:yes stop_codon:yes gene_type:complete
MAYIWNRAERVSSKLMPKRIIDCFAEWKESQEEKLKLIPNPEAIPMPKNLAKKFASQRYKIRLGIIEQNKNLKDAVQKFDNENK